MGNGNLTANQSGSGTGDGKENGMGDGRGRGARPEERTETNAYASRVQGKPRGGAGVLAGQAGGSNIVGDPRAQIEAAVEAAHHERDDPLAGQRLPRPQREQTQQYFNGLR